jgi:hypothetical protein
MFWFSSIARWRAPVSKKVLLGARVLEHLNLLSFNLARFPKTGIGCRGKTMPKIVKFALIGIVVCFVAIFCLAMLMIVIVLTSPQAPALAPLVIGGCSWTQTLH